jgi:hypothetical protein
VATSWFNISPVGESQGSTLNPKVPAGTITISVATGSGTYNTLLNDGTIVYKGKEYTTFQGPFPTETAALQGETDLISGLGYVGAAAGAVAAGVQAGTTGDTGSTGSLVSGGVSAGQAVSSWETALVDFLKRLTDANTWVRVAEVVLGLGLAIVALDKLLAGTSAGNVTHKVAKAAFLA